MAFVVAGGVLLDAVDVGHSVAEAVRLADRIIVMEHGHIVETGSHASLVALGGIYANLASLQFNSFE